MAEQRNDHNPLDVFDPEPREDDNRPASDADVYAQNKPVEEEKPGLLARIFGKKKPDPDEPDLRGGVFNPFAKRDAAITSLTRGFDQLTDLMRGIQFSLENSTEKQAELIDTLKHLPASVEQAAEANKIHGETLQAIREQVGHQSVHQEKLGTILDTIGQTGEAQRKGLDTLQERVEAMRQADAQMAENLSGVGKTMSGLGDAMRSVSDASVRSSDVLEQLRAHLDAKTDHLEAQMRKQSKWFSFLLGLALFLSFLALLFAGGMGYFMFTEIQKSNAARNDRTSINESAQSLSPERQAVIDDANAVLESDELTAPPTEPLVEPAAN